MTTTTMSDMMDAIQVAEQVEAGTMSPGVARVALLVGGCGGDVLDEIAALAPDRTKAEWLFGKAPAPEVAEAQVLHGCRMATVLIRSDDPRGEMGTRIPLESHDPADLEGLQRAGCEAIYQGLRQLSEGAGPEHADDRPDPPSTGNWVWNPDGAQWMPDPDRDSELARRATAILRTARLEGRAMAFEAAKRWIEEEVTGPPDRRVKAQIADLPGGLDLELAREDTECPESFLARAKAAARAGDLVAAGQLLRRSMARQEVLETAEATPAPSNPRSVSASQPAPVEPKARPEPQPLVTLHIGPEDHPDRYLADHQHPTRDSHPRDQVLWARGRRIAPMSVNTHSADLVCEYGFQVARGVLAPGQVRVRWYADGTVGDASFNAAGVLIGAPVGILSP